MKRRIKKLKKYIFACFYIFCSEIRIILKKSLNGDYNNLILLATRFPSKFRKYKKYNDKANLIHLQKKKMIHFGFVVYTSSMWDYDELYHLLKNTDNVIVDLIIAHIYDEKVAKELLQLEYKNTLSSFESRGFKVLEANETCVKDYDILFYLTPYKFREEFINIKRIPLNILLLHSSYSYMLSGNSSKLNLWLYHLAFYYYTDTNYYKKLIESSPYSTGSARFIGFPKMDQFYTADFKRRSSKKIIIYAPHHSVNYEEFKSATFEDNYLAILELAKKYYDSTYWIYKPHPLLRPHSVESGIFNTVEEYDQYEKSWSDLDNADVVTSGEYFSLFKESDAMITDSVSFLAEYQFTHNPLLLLESGKEKYNEFGNSIVDILYKCSGNDIPAIESFIEDVISGKDEMKEVRAEFFDKNLSYRNESKSANYRIYQDILNFTGKNELIEEK